jgi:putrescine aminotransferase
MGKLISFDEVSHFSIEEVWNLYRNHINPYQVELLTAFGAGRELVSHSVGSHIFLKSGRKILDLTGGIGVLNHGHNHPRVLRARKEFSERRLMEVHKNFFSPFTAALAHNVAQLLPGDLEVSYFPNSGAEAVEGSLKMAYKARGDSTKKKILHADISFHGKLWAPGEITGSVENHFRFPTSLETRKFRYNDITDLRKAVSESITKDGTSDVFALVLEPMNASSMTIATPDFLNECRRLALEHDIVLIFDEVYTGWGKTGHLFNFMRVDGLVPDILCYAKSFGGGKASISGFTATKSLALAAYGSLRDSTLHSTTYFGFGEEAATALEAINIIVDEDLVERSAEIGKLFQDHLRPVMGRLGGKFSLEGSGALWGITPSKTFTAELVQLAGDLSKLSGGDKRFGSKVIGGALVSALYDHHGILTYIGFNVTNPLIVSFPLVTDDADVIHAAQALENVLERAPLKLILDFVRQRPKSLNPS